MAQIIGLPKLSPTMEEGVLVRWTKKEGDKVAPGDLVAEVETDKANMDFNIEDEGVLLKLLVKEGETVKLGAPVAIIGKAGEDVSALVEEARASGLGPQDGKASDLRPQASARTETPSTTPSPSPRPPPSPIPVPKPEARGLRPEASSARPEASSARPEASSATPGAPSSKLLASPLAKTLAIELGIDLRTVHGSGPGGRIVERDVRAAAGNGHAAPTQEAPADVQPPPTQALAVRHARQLVPDADGDFTDVPASNMRKRIAQRLTEAKRDVPHFYLMRTFDAAPMLGFRARLNALLGDKGKVSVNDLIVKAVALALRRMPECNASWAGESIRRYHHVNIGVAVAIDDGLVTPVVFDADQKGLGAISAEVRDLAERAKTRRLKAHEITGSTFSVSNLGMFAIERFTAILNPPEAGILAIGAVVDAPIIRDGQVVAGKTMTVTMSCDHRVIDGALGARWLAAFVELIEHPESLAL
jgi:pyruvate dehydrogenase E2 component (dihydrolipoamide acetyltransferase)